MIISKKKNNEILSLISGSLAEIYKSGISINEGLQLIINSIYSKDYKASLKKVLSCVKNGNTLSDGFKNSKELYSGFFIGMICIGEESGKLYEVLKGLSIYYERCEFIKREITNACIYPSFVFASFIALGFIALYVIVPDFCEIYKSMNIELPPSGKFLYSLSMILKENLILSLISIICWGVFIPFILFKYFNSIVKAEFFIRFQIVKDTFEYLMIIILSIITSCGINISYCLNYCEDYIDSFYLREKIHNINNNIRKGSTLSEALEYENIFSHYTIAIIKVKEESGNIESAFNELSVDLGKKINKKIKRYIKFIEPILMLILSLIIVIFLIVFFMPLFSNLNVGIRL